MSDWIPLEKPLRHGWWVEWVPKPIYIDTPEAFLIQQAIDFCSRPVWTGRKDRLRKDYRNRWIKVTPALERISRLKTFETSDPGVKKYFMRIEEPNLWGGWYDYYYPTESFKRKIQIHIRKCWVTHTRTINGEIMREQDELNYRVFCLTGHPYYYGRGKRYDHRRFMPGNLREKDRYRQAMNDYREDAYWIQSGMYWSQIFE